MEQKGTKDITNREVKSSAFTTYFGKPENAAELYSALDGVMAAPEEIVYTTLEGVLFVARKNDMAFTVRNRVLVISEHQSTVNLNMPFRDVIYYGRTMEKLIDSRSLYRRKQILIPTPEFYVFYNGNEIFPVEKTLCLSDAYLDKTVRPMLELNVKVININLPIHHEILNKCKPLYEYSWFVQRIREYLRAGNRRDSAIIYAIEDCEREGIMVEFVREYGSEAINMLFTQFNMDDALEVSYEEGFEDGKTEGEKRKLIQLVCRMLQKGKEVSAIVEDLEVETAEVERIATIARNTGFQNVERIYEALQEKQNLT